MLILKKQLWTPRNVLKFIKMNSSFSDYFRPYLNFLLSTVYLWGLTFTCFYIKKYLHINLAYMYVVVYMLDIEVLM